MTKIKNYLFVILGFICGLVYSFFIRKVKANKKQPIKREKYIMYYNLLNQWLMLKNKNILLVDRFKERNIKSIAIYGVGEIGSRLIEELNNSNIEIKYAIDNDPNKNIADIKIISLNKEMEYVDVIVVTAIFDYDDIVKSIKNYTDINIISIEDIIYNNY